MGDWVCQYCICVDGVNKLLEGKVSIGIDKIVISYGEEEIRKHFHLITRVSYQQDDLYFTIEIKCKDFQRIVFRVAKLKEINTTDTQKGVHESHLKGAIKRIENGFHKFGEMAMGKSVPVWSLHNEVLRQGYKVEFDQLKIVQFENCKLILPCSVSYESLLNLTNFHFKKIPSYCWGCWDPNSPYFGSIILMGGRPAIALGEDSPNLTYPELSKMKSYSDQSESFNLLYSFQRIQEIYTKSHKKKPFVIFDNGEKTNILSSMFKNYPVLSQKCFYDEIETKCEALYEEALRYQFLTHKEFLKAIDNIEWYATITKYLSISKQLVKTLKKQGVILYIQNGGPECGDTNLIILSLIQIFVDPYYRTFTGFFSLIFKDWVYFREFHVPSETPWWSFFTFLSCLYELMMLNLEQFEFNTNFLNVVMDMVHTTKLASSDSLKEKDSAVAVAEQLDWKIFKNVEYKKELVSDLKISKNEKRISEFLWYPYILRHNPSLSELFKKIRKTFNTANLQISDFGFLLPPLFGLRYVTSLAVTNSSLSQIPQEIKLMPLLLKLSVEDNCLRKLPTFIGETLTNLVEINASRNKLFNIPSLSRLTNLKTLLLDSNNIQKLNTIFQLPSLITLSLENNKVDGIPTNSKLTDLTELNLSQNSLPQPPPSLFSQCPKLKKLSLCNAEIVILPNIFQNLLLFEMHLKSNSIYHLPPSIFLLENLQTLDLSQNQLEVVPESIGQLTRLRTLDLANNKLKTLPTTMKDLAILENLRVNHNQLEKIPSCCFKLWRLKTLDVSSNKVCNLSVGVCQMTSLEKLNLSGNSLVELPLSLGLLNTTLKELSIDKEILGNIPTSDTRTVLDTLSEELKKKNTVNRIKVIFIGAENAGKSALLETIKRKWVTKGGEVISVTSTTGMDVHTIQFIGKKNKFTASLWDFKGTTTYESLQQFFFSTNAIYLLVFNIASVEPLEKQLQLLSLSIKSIKTRVRDPKLRLVATHTDLVSPIIRSDRLNYFCTNLANLIEVKKIVGLCAKSLLEIPPLTKFIQKCASSDPEELKNSYQLIEALLQEHSNVNESTVPILTFKDFKRLIGSLFNIKHPTEMKNCARTLHKLGSIIFYEKNTKEEQSLVALDPKWLFEVMAAFFSNNGLYMLDGVLDPNDLEHIWTFYPKEIYPNLVSLLESFDLIICVEQNLNTLKKVIKAIQEEDDHSPPISLCSFRSEGSPFIKTKAILVPSLLPKKRPDKLIDKLWYKQPGMPHINRIFHFNFIPNGLFHRFLSRVLNLHPSVILTTLWSNGVILYIDSVYVFVQQVTSSSDGIGLEENEIYIEVRSGEKHYMREIFFQLCSALISIAISWDYIGWTRYVVFPQDTDFKKINIETVIAKLPTIGDFEDYEGMSLSNIIPEIMVSNFQERRIALSNITKGSSLGKGAFAEVFEGTLTKKNEVFAVKQMLFRVSSELHPVDVDKDLSTFRKEVMIHSKLKHPNVLSLLAIGVNPHCIYLELCNTNLWNYKSTLPTTPWKVKYQIALDIASAMNYLHSQKPPIAHLDLKSPNVLLQIDIQNQITSKVADFGTAREVVGHIVEKNVDNPTWLAPEILVEQPHYTEAVDIYSYGLVYWEIITCCPLFPGLFFSEIVDKTLSGERLKIPTECPERLRDLITRCWYADPTRRPRWDEIMDTTKTLIVSAEQEVVLSKEKPPKSTRNIKMRSIDKMSKEKVNLGNNYEDLLYNDKQALKSFKEFLISVNYPNPEDILPYQELIYKYKTTGSNMYSQALNSFLANPTAVSDYCAGIKKIFDEYNSMDLIGVNLEELYFEISSALDSRVDAQGKTLEDHLQTWKSIKKKEIPVLSTSEPPTPPRRGSQQWVALSPRHVSTGKIIAGKKHRPESENFTNPLPAGWAECYKLITENTSALDTLQLVYTQFLAPGKSLAHLSNSIIEKIEILLSQTEKSESRAKELLIELMGHLDAIKIGKT